MKQLYTFSSNDFKREELLTYTTFQENAQFLAAGHSGVFQQTSVVACLWTLGRL
jgi:hypothetical protein